MIGKRKRKVTLPGGRVVKEKKFHDDLRKMSDHECYSTLHMLFGKKQSLDFAASLPNDLQSKFWGGREMAEGGSGQIPQNPAKPGAGGTNNPGMQAREGGGIRINVGPENLKRHVPFGARLEKRPVHYKSNELSTYYGDGGAVGRVYRQVARSAQNKAFRADPNKYVRNAIMQERLLNPEFNRFTVEYPHVYFNMKTGKIFGTTAELKEGMNKRFPTERWVHVSDMERISFPTGVNAGRGRFNRDLQRMNPIEAYETLNTLYNGRPEQFLHEFPEKVREKYKLGKEITEIVEFPSGIKAQRGKLYNDLYKMSNYDFYSTVHMLFQLKGNNMQEYRKFVGSLPNDLRAKFTAGRKQYLKETQTRGAGQGAAPKAGGEKSTALVKFTGAQQKSQGGGGSTAIVKRGSSRWNYGGQKAGGGAGELSNIRNINWQRGGQKGGSEGGTGVTGVEFDRSGGTGAGEKKGWWQRTKEWGRNVYNSAAMGGLKSMEEETGRKLKIAENPQAAKKQMLAEDPRLRYLRGKGEFLDWREYRAKRKAIKSEKKMARLVRKSAKAEQWAETPRGVRWALAQRKLRKTAAKGAVETAKLQEKIAKAREKGNMQRLEKKLGKAQEKGKEKKAARIGKKIAKLQDSRNARVAELEKRIVAIEADIKSKQDMLTNMRESKTRRSKILTGKAGLLELRREILGAKAELLKAKRERNLQKIQNRSRKVVRKVVRIQANKDNYEEALAKNREMQEALIEKQKKAEQARAA
ncbi:MAG: hypothetical protein ABH854_01245 [Candidatus Diapherotrites archaeon]|nr:hypothetical protein [Candidatus Micrarchaeota archaeon]MBU1939525.1 hypothetical protein [Candidatus Micrarchaeota archaeon]